MKKSDPVHANLAFQNAWESVTWLAALSFVATAIALLSTAYFEVNNQFQTEDSIRLVPALEIPFPSVIVDVGDNLDPLGYGKASRFVMEEPQFLREGRGGRDREGIPTI